MSGKRIERADDLRQRLRADLRQLKRWRQSALNRIAARQANVQGAVAARLKHEQYEIEKLFEQRQVWLNDTFTTEDNPYLRLVAVFTGK